MWYCYFKETYITDLIITLNRNKIFKTCLLFQKQTIKRSINCHKQSQLQFNYSLFTWTYHSNNGIMLSIQESQIIFSCLQFIQLTSTQYFNICWLVICFSESISTVNLLLCQERKKNSSQNQDNWWTATKSDCLNIPYCFVQIFIVSGQIEKIRKKPKHD